MASADPRISGIACESKPGLGPPAGGRPVEGKRGPRAVRRSRNPTAGEPYDWFRNSSKYRFRNKLARRSLICGTEDRTRWRHAQEQGVLLEQIARAERFAQAMNTQADRDRFDKIAADYRSELDAAEAAAGQASAAEPVPSEGATQANEATVAQPDTANSSATEPTEGEQGPTTNWLVESSTLGTRMNATLDPMGV